FRLDYHRPRTKIPVWIAAITPKSIHQTGEIGDGIFPIHWPRRLFGQLREDLAAGAKDAGRPGHEFTIAPFTKTTVLDGTEEDEVAASRAAWAERDAEGSIAAISDEMVRECQVIGPIEEVAERLRERSDAGADIQMLYMPPGTPAEVGKWLEAVMK